jgi:hypothetical protein
MKLLLVLLSLAAACPTYTCADLDSGVCSTYTSQNEYSINKNPCPSSSYCGYEDFVSWQSTNLVGEVLSCSSTDSGAVAADTGSVYLCGTRIDSRDLVDGSYPKVCDSYVDCKLNDGSYSECECGMDGKAYCVPDINSETFDDYWKECWADNYGRLDNYKHWAYWELKSTYYVPYTSAYSCAHNLFSEFIQIDDYDYIGDIAATVTGSLMVAVSLLA